MQSYGAESNLPQTCSWGRYYPEGGSPYKSTAKGESAIFWKTLPIGTICFWQFGGVNWNSRYFTHK